MGTTINEGDGEEENKKGSIKVGVLALQGAFHEHIQLLERAAHSLTTSSSKKPTLAVQSWTFLEVRTVSELNQCDALIIPGGESTAISLVAQRSNLLEPLREFVKVHKKPTWGTCAGLILLAESANRTKGGQELIGGLDVRVNRNHFGRQIESFEAALDLPFLRDEPCVSTATATATATAGKDSKPSTDHDQAETYPDAGTKASRPFSAIFIRAPIVEKLLLPGPTHVGDSAQDPKAQDVLEDETVVVAPAPSSSSRLGVLTQRAPVEVLGRLPGRRRRVAGAAGIGDDTTSSAPSFDPGDIVAVRQGNVFGTSFHPELTGDPRIHVWWLEQVALAVKSLRSSV